MTDIDQFSVVVYNNKILSLFYPEFTNAKHENGNGYYNYLLHDCLLGQTSHTGKDLDLMNCLIQKTHWTI